MSVYKIPITTAFLIFPFIAFLFTLPYLIYEYRKYGSIPLLRSIIVYSFILYLLNAYFLVILPLPSIESVSKLTTPYTQLIPFDFIRQISSLSLDWTQVSSYISLIHNPSFYIAAFNILLTLPLGIYLRYYFECKWYKALILGFGISLFFEITQLTGLYGIYPRPYRLFDVDDLILNTTGTMLGFAITPMISFILPTRKELDAKSFKKGKKVTFFRRVVAFFIDLFFLTIMFVAISILTYNSSINTFAAIITLLLYYLGIPLLTNGKTPGKVILKIQVVAKRKTKYNIIKVELRYLLSYILFYYQFVLINVLKKLPIENDIGKIIITGCIIILTIYFWINIFSIVINIVKKNKVFLYEKLSNTEHISTIEYEDPEEKNNLEENIENRKKEKKNVGVKEDK